MQLLSHLLLGQRSISQGSWRIRSNPIINAFIYILKIVSCDRMCSAFCSNHRAITKVSWKQIRINSCRPEQIGGQVINTIFKSIYTYNKKYVYINSRNWRTDIHQNNLQFWCVKSWLLLNQILQNYEQEITLFLGSRKYMQCYLLVLIS